MGMNGGRMGRLLRRGPKPGQPRVRRGQMDPADEAHLVEFLATRHGVEGFVEPRTAVSDVTLVIVAHDGEWTRRRVPSAAWAHDFANTHGIASYDAAVVGYPQRMRDYNQRRKDSGYAGA
jgi:hypothetical protein